MTLPIHDGLKELALSGIRQYTVLANQTEGCIKMAMGEPEFDTPMPIREAAIQSIQNGETHYPPGNGIPELLDALSQFAKKQGMDYAPDEIVVTAGATGALFSALFGLLNPGDEVLVPTPAFGLYDAIIRLTQAVCCEVDVSQHGFQLTRELLEQHCTGRTKAIVVTSPGNPTGCIYNRESLQAVAELAREKGLYVICDDVYNQLIYTSDYTRFAVEYPDLRKQIVVVDSFSKPYAMTGWRAGWLMADKSLKEQLQKVHQFSVVSITSFIQKACITALGLDVSDMRESYRQRRDFVCARLEQMGLSFPRPEGAFYIFVSIKEFGLSDEEFCVRLIKEGGLGVIPGSCFGTPGYVRLSYCQQQEQLEEGMNRLEAFVQKLR